MRRLLGRFQPVFQGQSDSQLRNGMPTVLSHLVIGSQKYTRTLSVLDRMPDKHFAHHLCWEWPFRYSNELVCGIMPNGFDILPSKHASVQIEKNVQNSDTLRAAVSVSYRRMSTVLCRVRIGLPWPSSCRCSWLPWWGFHCHGCLQHHPSACRGFCHPHPCMGPAFGRCPATGSAPPGHPHPSWPLRF